MLGETSPDAFWNRSAEQIIADLQSTPQGLTSEEARRRLLRDGPNALQERRRHGILPILLAQFTTPITLILLFATAVSFFLGDVTDAAIILAIVGISGLLGFYQEFHADHTVARLLEVIRVRSRVVRDGAEIEVPVEELAVGDLVRLDAGDVIPADMRLIESNGLAIDESTLTGEPLPVEKQPEPLPPDTPLARRASALWMGTHVQSGNGSAYVVRVGRSTEFGKIFDRLSRKESENDFERGVRHFGTMLIEITFILVLAIFVINLALQKPAFDSLLFSLALAVGLTPQLLPAIITVNLSHGARAMAKRQVIVKKLNSIENFGAMNILCSDKTGTVTVGVVRLENAVDAAGKTSDTVYLAACLNAGLHSGSANPIDQAILADRSLQLDDGRRPESGEDRVPGLSEDRCPDLSAYRKLDEIVYNFTTRRLSVLVDPPPGSPLGDRPLLITKGACRNVLEICSQVRTAQSDCPIAEYRNDLNERYEQYGKAGYRTLGVAVKTIEEDPVAVRDEQMTFIGFLILMDPLKPGITETVERMRALGVDLKIITGDNCQIAASIAGQLGLDPQRVISGEQVAELNDAALAVQAGQASIFAEIEPNQKERIVLACKRGGNVVGYLGDGINDAAALHAADVGISVNTGADAAKNAAGIVLLQQDLKVLIDGIMAGRKTFANTLKYVFMAASANFGNMFSMAGASIFLPFLPLLPKQILLTNLLTDLPEMQIASDRVDPEQLEKPRRWDLRMIRRFMLVFGLLSSLFDYITFALLRYGWQAGEALFQSAWFTESIISASLAVLVIRTQLPFYRSKPGCRLTVTTALVVLLTLILPYTPAAEPLRLIPVPLPLLGVLALIIIAYMACAELTKHVFYHRKGKVIQS